MATFAPEMKDGAILKGHLACFSAYAIFGFNIIVCKDLMSGELLSPLGVYCLRSIGACLMFWLLSLFLPREKVERRDLPKIVGASAVGFLLTQLTFLMAIRDITPVDCSIVGSMTPIYTMLIAAVVLREPLSVMKCGGVALSFLGVIYLILSGYHGQSEIHTSVKGVVLQVINSISFAVYLGVFRPVISKYSVVTFMKWVFLFSVLMSLPLAGGELAGFDWNRFRGAYAWEMSFLVILATFTAYFLIPVGQKLLRPTLVSMYSYVQPIIAVGVSVAIGMDSLTIAKILAALAVVGGVILVNRSKSAPQSKPDSDSSSSSSASSSSKS